MAMTSTFEADFTLFRAQVSIAQTALQGFEKDTEQVAASLTKMEQSISGQAIVQAATIAAEAVERLGGVSKLTYGELQRLGTTAQEAVDKLNALGEKVPKNIQDLADRARGAAEEMLRMKDAATGNQQATINWGGALQSAAGYLGALGIDASINGVLNFTKSVFDSADQIQTMSERLGISAEAVQGFKAAAEQSGSSLDAVGQAIMRMNKNLAEPDKGTIAALHAAGLEFSAIASMTPEEAFRTIADAIGKMTDPMEQAKAGAKLLGGTFAELLPAMKKGFGDTADAAMKMSNDTVKLLADAEAAWKKLSNQIVIISGEIIANTDKAVTNITGSWKGFFDYLGNLMQGGAGYAGMMAVMNQNVIEMGNSSGKVLGDIQLGVRKTKEEVDAAAAAHKKWADAVTEVNSIGQTWRATLADIDEWTLNDIASAVKAGASIETMAKFYGLTDSQGKAVTLMMQDQEKQVKALAKAQADADSAAMASYNARIKVMEESEKAAAKGYGIPEQIQQLQLLDARERELTASVYANITSEKDRMKLIEDYGKKHEAISNQIMALENKKKDTINQAIIDNLKAQKEADAMMNASVAGPMTAQQQAYQAMQRSLDALNAKKIEGVNYTGEENKIYATYQKAVYDAALADDAQTQALARKNNELDKTKDKLKQAADAAKSTYETLQGGVKMPGWTSGSIAGSNYLVGPNGQMIQIGPHGELPDNIGAVMAGVAFPDTITNQPRIGTGFGPDPGGRTTINITQPLGTPQAIASAVGDALMGQLRGQGVRTP